MTCQGEGGVEIYLEPVLATPSLVILGHTPVAQSLARLGAELGFDVAVCTALASVEAFPPGVRLETDPSAALASSKADTYVVVATMGSGDEESLAAAAASEAAYVGLVASRKKGRHLLEYVAATGTAPERLQRVKFPAGLDLGGMSAPEIAVSIVAEIIQVRNALRALATGASVTSVLESTPAARVDPPLPNTSSKAAPSPIGMLSISGSGVATPASEKRSRTLSMAPFPIDPVCGMPVEPAGARHTLTVDGGTVYFCCPHCKAAYERNRQSQSV
jgi:xanthine dehydrogenase accessory factor